MKESAAMQLELILSYLKFDMLMYTVPYEKTDENIGSNLEGNLIKLKEPLALDVLIYACLWTQATIYLVGDCYVNKKMVICYCTYFSMSKTYIFRLRRKKETHFSFFNVVFPRFLFSPKDGTIIFERWKLINIFLYTLKLT